MDNKKVLLSVKDLHVKFRVRGRTLTAIRGISLDLYEGESIAIVGESGSGKSVFTKTFAGMLESNGYISEGSIIFNDDQLSDTVVKNKRGTVANIAKTLNRYSKLELGSEIYVQIKALEAEKKAKSSLSAEEEAEISAQKAELAFKRTEEFNFKQTIDPKDKAAHKASAEKIAVFDEQIKQTDLKKKALVASRKAALKKDSEYLDGYKTKRAELLAAYKAAIKGEISEETKTRNLIIAKEIYLSVGRYGFVKRQQYIFKLCAEFKKAFRVGLPVSDDTVRNELFDKVVFRVKYLDETETVLHGTCLLNLAKVNYDKDWGQIRGSRIATVFQDPMTSLNPVITIGKQITSIIIKHQGCSEIEARARALELMKKVGIPNAENRFDDYPFQYSGGMRQRIVIAIALSCQPKILICDEPTTALDVTIQAQILKLIKDLQKEFGYTIVFITHDLGVVANVAERVAVLYAGQVVELGTVEEVFYDPRHPYTWALLSSLPQLAQRNTKLYSITGTPPSLYNSIVGDAFAPRNPHCLKIDTLKEPPMFQVSETHFAKTWLLDPRAPKISKPEAIEDIHEKLKQTFNI